MSGQPLVTCIMPTCHRREYLEQAVGYFLRQTYPNKELMIVEDDSPPPLSAWLETAVDGFHIRYIRMDKRHNVGFLRNAACQASSGEFILHWDDDDWMAPRRIEYQLAALLAGEAAVCGLRSLLFYDGFAETGPAAWRYVYPPARRPWLAGGSLLYRREVWERNPFADLRTGEDTRFVWGLQPFGSENKHGLLALPDETFYVAMIHPHNTSPKQPRSLYWRQAETGWVRGLMGGDIQFYDNLVEHQQAQNGTLPNRPERHAVTNAVHPPHLIRKTLPEEKIAAMPAQNHDLAFDSGLVVKSRPCVTVAIPFYRTPETLKRAVESILAQTYSNLRLVVVGDGPGLKIQEILGEVHDRRLVLFELQENRGRYFADQVVLSATTDPFFLVQDADDWSEPTRLEKLFRALRAGHAQAALSIQAVHENAQNTISRVERYPGLTLPLGRRLDHRANHHGLYEAAALRAIGGFFAGFRIGYDTLLVNWLLMSGGVACVHEPLYHRLIHLGSLTQSKETGPNSAARRSAVEALRQLYEHGCEHYLQYLEGTVDLAELCTAIRSLALQGVERETQIALDSETERLRSILETPASQQRSPQITGQRPEVKPIPEVIVPTVEPILRIVEKNLRHPAPAPTVSCILATGNRLGFTRQAIRCFLRQTYDDCELVVVDDGIESAEALCADLLRVRYIRLSEPTLLGTKLNIGIQHARGRIIQKLDDDDYYAPTFLENALRYLSARPKSLVSWESFLVLMAGEQKVRYAGRGWTTGGTLCFARPLWLQNPFRPAPSQVDTWFIEDNRPEMIKVNEPELYLMVRHGKNTWKTLSSGVGVNDYFAGLPLYHLPLQKVVEPLDLDFYSSL